jgi:hypothetical protein
LLFKLGRLPEALADLDRAVAAHPDGQYHYTARGQIHAALGNQASADSDFEEGTKEQLALLREMQVAGKLVRAVLVQANSHLFSPGLSDYPGYVLFSFDPELNRSLQPLHALAERMAGVKGKACDGPDDQFLSDLITDEVHRGDKRARLPVSVTGGKVVYGSGLMFHRAFLAAGHLTENVFRCLAEPGDQGRIRLLPHWAVKKKGEDRPVPEIAPE